MGFDGFSSAAARRLLLVGHSNLQALISANAERPRLDIDLQVLQARDPQYASWATWEAGSIINPALVNSISATIARVCLTLLSGAVRCVEIQCHRRDVFDAAPWIVSFQRILVMKRASI